jgi:hypothetical protein
MIATMRHHGKRWLWLGLLLLMLQGPSGCRWIAGYDAAQRDGPPPDITRPDVGRQDLQPDISPDISPPDVSSPDVLAPDVLAPDLGCPRVNETHVQTLVRKVDVLFVVDTGGSMSQELPLIEDAALAFAKEAKKHMLDAQLGVVAIDTATLDGKQIALGALLGTPPFLDVSTSALGVELKKRFKATVGGNERGLDAVYAALTPPLSQTTNAGFNRAGSSLEVLAFTDEPGSSTITPAQLLTFLRGLVAPTKGTHVRVHALLSQTCAGNGTLSTNWQTLVQLSGGLLGDLCATSYDAIAIAAAKRFFGLRDQFFLGQTPSDPSQILVTVDGKPLSTWTHDPVSNSVTFATPPGDNSAIDLTYPVCP